MLNRNLFIVIFFLLCNLTSVADIALPKKADLQDTKYYFANVDSFSNYTFYVKKNANNKTYRIKQTASFLLKENEKIGDERLEVWAIKNNDKQKTNSFILQRVKTSLDYGGPTAYIAIQFFFDKKNNLSFKQTVMKPDCYKKKQQLPLFVIKNNFLNNQLQLLMVSLISLTFLGFLFSKNKARQHNAYV